MANEIYDSTWWGNTIDTASSIGTSTEMIQGQFNLTKLGDEEVTNGDFSDGSTDWSVTGLATISNGVASFVDNGTNTNSYINQNVFTVGKFYKVTFDITRYVAGRIQLQVNSTYSVDISGGVGTYTTYIKSTNIRLLIKRDGSYANYDFDIDNVSVKEARATTVEASKCLADAIHRIGIQNIQN